MSDGGPASGKGTLIGQRLGNYRIIRKIGEGGMGAVYEAQHEQIGRRAAIKVLHAGLALDPQISTRFLNEARAANLVQHAGIVDIYEFGKTPEGAAYIIMQYLDGESLRARIRRQRRLGGDALRLGRQLASVLAAAHDKQIVHRDLKPDNVMIVPDSEAPGGERVKVLDFGIAKVTAELQVPGGGPRTHTGMLLGTPDYMAPEQCRGLSSLDARADVYALGILLYEMVAGERPFQGDMGELIAAHIYKPPPPLPPELSGAAELAGLLPRMLAKAPAERPSMRDVAAELEAQGAPRASGAQKAGPLALVGPEVLSPPLSTMGRAAGQAAGPLLPIHRLRTVALICGLFAVGVGVAALLRGSNGAAPASPGGAAQGSRPAPRRVRWVVRSEPAGAQVVRQGDERVLGTTPWEEEHEAVRGAVSVVLRKPGYEDREVMLEQDKDERRDEKLDREGPAAPVPVKPAPVVAVRPPKGPAQRKISKGTGTRTKPPPAAPSPAEKPKMWN